MRAVRRQLRSSVAGDRYPLLLARTEPAEVEELGELFHNLDRDGDGSLSVRELNAGLSNGNGTVAPARVASLLEAMDLDGNGHVDAVEFSELMLRLKRLRAGEERLLHYLVPVDADGDQRLDPGEVDRLLRSVGQEPLNPAEQQALFGAAAGGSLSWQQFLDRLLLC